MRELEALREPRLCQLAGYDIHELGQQEAAVRLGPGQQILTEIMEELFGGRFQSGPPEHVGFITAERRYHLQHDIVGNPRDAGRQL